MRRYIHYRLQSGGRLAMRTAILIMMLSALLCVACERDNGPVRPGMISNIPATDATPLPVIAPWFNQQGLRVLELSHGWIVWEGGLTFVPKP